MDLLQSFFDWLRRVIGIAPSVAQRKALEEYTQSDRTLRLLFDQSCDDDFPGLVALWLCESQKSSRDCLILVANLAQLREWLFRMRDHGRETAEQTQWRRSLEIKARAAIREQENVSGTHLFIVATVAKPDAQQFRHLDCVGAWIVDMVGIHTYMGQNTVAIKVARAVSMKVLHIDDGRLLTWEQAIFDGKQPWLYWIEEFTRHLMNSPMHNIQPPKPKRASGDRP